SRRKARRSWGACTTWIGAINASRRSSEASGLTSSESPWRADVAAKKRVTQAAADELVKRYILDKVRAQATADQDLFDSVLALHDLAEQRETSHDSAQRLGELRDSPMVRAAMAVLGQRFQRVADIGVRIAKDTLALRIELRSRLEAEGIDPTDRKQHAA